MEGPDFYERMGGLVVVNGEERIKNF